MLYRRETKGNISPLLFSLFLNDLEETFKTHGCNGISFGEKISDNVLHLCLVLFVLL